MTGAWGLAVLRAIVGLTFLAHGVPKLLPLVGGAAPAVVLAGSFAGAGWPGILVGLVETAGGVALLGGAYTTWVSLVLVCDRLAGAWLLHRANGYFLNWSLQPGAGHGFEYHVVLLGALVCLILTGPGGLSWDERRARSAETAALGRARLRSR